jgi:hypothetical protein
MACPHVGRTHDIFSDRLPEKTDGKLRNFVIAYFADF